MIRFSTRFAAIFIMSSAVAVMGTSALADSKKHGSGKKTFKQPSISASSYKRGRHRGHGSRRFGSNRSVSNSAQSSNVLTMEGGRFAWVTYEDAAPSGLRELVSTSPTRSPSKILHVTREQYEEGESRAARREAKMLANIENIRFRYYRPNEAYDERFPSIVYLEPPRR